MGILKNHSDIRSLNEAGCILREVLAALDEGMQPGASTVELEQIASRILSANRSTAPFKSFDGFGHAICVSINDEIVNGPPSRERILQSGDLVKVATAAENRGIHTKAARTKLIGDPPPAGYAIYTLLEGNSAVIPEAINRSQSVSTLNELLQVIPEMAERYSLTVIKGLGGFGIGKKLHEPPLVPNTPSDLTDTVPLQPGLCFTLMPMFSLGEDPESFTHEDGWTYVTNDHAVCAHFADTLLMTENGLINITGG